MIIYGAILLSFAITLVFYLLHKDQYKWWEFFLPPISTAVVALVFKLIFSTIGYNFNETWGSTIVSITEQEPYNYWHSETCYHDVPCGTDSDGNTEYCSEPYDCSHQVDVGPEWKAVTSINEHLSLTEKQYDSLVYQFGYTMNSRTIIDQHRNHSPNDKSAWFSSRRSKFEGKKVGKVSYVYETKWQGEDHTRKAVSTIHKYVNKIKASDLTIFNIKVIDKKQADTIGLFEYPKMTDYFSYPTILCDSISPRIQENFRKLNGKFGPSNQMRLWVLIFEDKPATVGEYQKNYWVKGNMNELVICMSKKDTLLQWVNVFSWTTNESLPIEIRNYITNQGKVNEKSLDELYTYLNENLSKFQRRDFSEFDYLKRRNKPWENIVVYIFGILASIGMNFWVSRNEFSDNENFNDKNSYNRYSRY